MKTYKQFINEQHKGVDYYVEKYNEWNNQNGKPGYSKPSYASVLEFLQNNYEDYSTDKQLIDKILKKLENI